jgi:hypothetical protein
MQDRPTIHELLVAVERFLDDEIVPSTDGRRQFLARVAAHALRLVDRELAASEVHAAREWAGLDDVLGAERPIPTSAADLRAELLRRNADLSEKIRRGDTDAGELRLRVLAHVRATVQDKLTVTNPAYLEADRRRHAETVKPSG